MYKIERTDYGLKLAFAGIMDKAEAYQFSSEFLRIIASGDKKFLAIIADAREFVPVTSEILEIIRETNQAAAAIVGNNVRVATILNSPVVRNMSIRSQVFSRADNIHRYINAAIIDDPELIAYDWAVKGIEPAVPINSEFEKESVC